MRNIIKSILEKVHSSYFERLTALSILNEQFSNVRKTPQYDTREQLWESVFSDFNHSPITVLEFGVYQGYSINKFATLNDCGNSEFYGFDSFEGLPEDWGPTHKMGTFDVGGKLPDTNDKRISFVPGWFQNTLPDFLNNTKINETLFVHYDADIFSASLYALLHIDSLKTPYNAVFDEFTGHEARALWGYIQMTGAKVEFTGCRWRSAAGLVGNKLYPGQVSCKIVPTSSYSP